jgi:hypothetical protein
MLHVTEDESKIVKEHPVLTLIQHKTTAIIVARVVAPRRRAVILIAIFTSIVITTTVRVAQKIIRGTIFIKMRVRVLKQPPSS